MFESYTAWLEQQPDYLQPSIEPFSPPESANTFTLDILPRTFTPIELYQTLSNPSSANEEALEDARYDIATFRVTFTDEKEEFLTALRGRFFSIPLVKFLLGHIGEEWMRFGEMRINLRDACGGLDIVNRDEVTMYTQNLYEWIEDLDNSGTFEFGIPRHSQLIRRRP